MGSALLPLPDSISTVAALFLPLFLIIGHVGLYKFIDRREVSFTNQLAVIFGICAPVLVAAMLTVQMSLVAYMEKYYHPLEQAAREAQINIWRAVDSVQLGLDVAWDMFILPTIMLFSICIMRHPAFGKIFGGIGFVLGLGGLVLNVATFPIPPINDGILFVLMIRANRKVNQT
jgi:hypothetical protein